MNFNVWNVKEMLSVPLGPGTNKSSNWNNNPDYSSLTDSQFLFGSQFCPENSQSLSASLDFNASLRYAKTSQQNSEDSEPSIFTKYQAKPQLFGGDAKDAKSHLPTGKSKGVLEQFEENKKRAQDKQDSEALNSFIFYVRESMHRLQTSVEILKAELSSRNQSILDALEAVSKTLQESAQAQCDLLLAALQDRSRMEQKALELEKQLEAKEAEFLDVKASLKRLEVIAAEQSRQYQRVCDLLDHLNFPRVLSEVHSLSSEAQLPLDVNNGGSQTLLALLQASNLSRKGKSTPESPDTGEAIMHLPHLNPLSSHPWEKCSAKKPDKVKDDTNQHHRNPAALGHDRGNQSVKDESVQTEAEVLAKRSSENRDSQSKIYGDHCKVQETAQFLSEAMNDLVTKARPTCILQDYQPKAQFCSNIQDQNKMLEQKGKSKDIRKRVKRKTSRKIQRGTCVRRKSSGLSRSTFSLRIEDSQSVLSKQQNVFLDQVENPRQPLSLLSPYKTQQPIVKGQGRVEKEARADSTPKAANSFFLYGSASSLPNSSEGDKQMKWFSDLRSNALNSPSAMEAKENSFYTIAFDSSDDDGE